MREEVRWFLEVLPDLGQEGAGVVAVLEYHPIDPGAELPEGVRLVAETQRLEHREHGDLERHRGKLPGSERRKTRIAEGGGHRVRFHVLGQGAVRAQRPDATAQPALESQGNEARAARLQPWQVFA